MRQRRAGDRLALPGDGSGLLTAVVRDNIDVVVLGRAVALLLEAPNPLPDLVETLVRAGP